MASLPRKWTQEEDEILRSHYFTHTRFEIAAILGRTHPSVRKRCSTLRLNSKNTPWSKGDDAILTAWYAERTGKALDTPLLAEALGRSVNSVGLRANELGITERKRPLPEHAKLAVGAATAARCAKQGHPRGALGMKHSEEAKRKIGLASLAQVRTPESEKMRVKKILATRMKNHGTLAPHIHNSTNAYSRTKSGKRADLDGRFFRSSWEANYARYLNFLIRFGHIQSWEFECQTFVFHGVTRGVLTYTPDFKVTHNDGRVEWHEVKGWMDAKSKAKLKRMAKFYPDETIVLIDTKPYRALEKKCRGMIAGWE